MKKYEHGYQSWTSSGERKLLIFEVQLTNVRDPFRVKVHKVCWNIEFQAQSYDDGEEGWVISISHFNIIPTTCISDKTL